jgi:hypothetical protein
MVTVSLVRKASGEPDYIVAVVEDIRPRKQAEEARRQADERLRIAIQGFPIRAFAQDAGLRYTWAFSPRYGDLAQSYVGRLDSDLLPPEVAGPLMALKQAVLDSGQALRREMPASGLQGVADHDLVSEPQCDAEGRVVGIIGAAMDITERRLAERQALDLAVSGPAEGTGAARVHQRCLARPAHPADRAQEQPVPHGANRGSGPPGVLLRHDQIPGRGTWKPCSKTC